MNSLNINELKRKRNNLFNMLIDISKIDEEKDHEKECIMVTNIACKYGMPSRITKRGIDTGKKLLERFMVGERLNRQESINAFGLCTILSVMEESVYAKQLVDELLQMINDRFSDIERNSDNFFQEYLLRQGFIEINPYFITSWRLLNGISKIDILKEISRIQNLIYQSHVDVVKMKEKSNDVQCTITGLTHELIVLHKTQFDEFMRGLISEWVCFICGQILTDKEQVIIHTRDIHRVTEKIANKVIIN